MAQGYWITHFIFIMSAWGRRPLLRTLFGPESIFLLANLHLVMIKGDVELVGEFCHSLHILGFRTPQCPILQEGIEYLLSVEKKRGKHGTWMKRSQSVFKRYHAAYCALIGLAPLQFLPLQTEETPGRRKEKQNTLAADTHVEDLPHEWVQWLED